MQASGSIRTERKQELYKGLREMNIMGYMYGVWICWMPWSVEHPGLCSWRNRTGKSAISSQDKLGPKDPAQQASES